ncbi:MAG: Radical SAM domain protein [Petrotoga mobilis]|nr:MAG: Radical SAM domain protein [Petrotoga mobilis]
MLNIMPETLIWDVTQLCNLSCIHCYNNDRYGKNNIYHSEKDLTTEEAKNAIEKIANSGVKHIHLLGGEPFCRKDIFELCGFAKKEGLMVTVNTNGLFLTPENCEKLVFSEVDSITVSLDGATSEVHDRIRGRGVFDQVIKNLEVFLNKRNGLKSKIKVFIAFTMLNYNIHQIPLIVDLAMNMGLDGIDIMELYSSGNASNGKFDYSKDESIKQMEMLARKLRNNQKYFSNFFVQLDTVFSLVEYLNKKYLANFSFNPEFTNCTASDGMFYMQADGELHPCGVANNPLYNKNLLNDGAYKIESINIKNIRSLEEMVKSDYNQTFLNFKKLFRARQFTQFPICSSCEHRTICSQLCPIIYYYKNNIEICSKVKKLKNNFIRDMINKKVFLRREVLKKEENDKIYLWDPQWKTYRLIEGSGNEIWRLIEKGENEIRNIIKELDKKYSNEVKRDKIKEDVVFFINELYNSEFVTLEEL